MQRHIDDELKTLNANLMRMATLTEESIHKSIEALKNQDKELAKSVIISDEVIDDLEIQIDEEATNLLALYQPMAKDLRFITTGMKVNTELERIADLAVNICQRVLEIADQSHLKPLIKIPKLAECAKKMVKGAIDAFVRKDEELAKSVIISDLEANELRNLIMQELINDYMVKDKSSVPRAVPLLLVARDLERICDHATNIAEDVIYIVKAKLVKHHLDELFAKEKKDK